jgi:hypothetical protein
MFSAVSLVQAGHCIDPDGDLCSVKRSERPAAYGSGKTASQVNAGAEGHLKNLSPGNHRLLVALDPPEQACDPVTARS